MLGLDELKGLCPPRWLCDSMDALGRGSAEGKALGGRGGSSTLLCPSTLLAALCCRGRSEAQQCGILSDLAWGKLLRSIWCLTVAEQLGTELGVPGEDPPLLYTDQDSSWSDRQHCAA